MKNFFEETLKKVPDEFGMYKCPLHASVEHTVYVKDNNFLCLHCGASGDVEQLKTLLKRNSIAQKHFTDEQKRIFSLNKIAMEYFQNSLARSEIAKKYVSDRGLDEETIALFNIGFANQDWTATKQYLLEKGFTEQEIIDAGITFYSPKTNKSYDFYRNRLMFPIKDAWGNVIGFSGRTIVNDEKKYINTSENIVFHKRQGFYNLNNFDSDYRHVIICEGQMDVIAFAMAKLPNAVATLGTALTLAHVKILSNIADEIYLCFDGDNAGQSALAKAVVMFDQEGVKTKKMVTLNGCKDPDEVLKKYGRNGLVQMIKNAKSTKEEKA